MQNITFSQGDYRKIQFMRWWLLGLMAGEIVKLSGKKTSVLIYGMNLVTI